MLGFHSSDSLVRTAVIPPLLALGLIGSSLSPLSQQPVSANGTSERQTQIPANSPEITTLELGKPIERELAGGQRHIFHVALAEGQVAAIVIQHAGFDLALRWMDAQGTVIIETAPRPGEAQDVLEFVGEKPGAYRIQVEPRYPKASSGKYQIQMSNLRAANERDVVLYEARRRSSESLKFYEIGAYEKAYSAAERALELGEKALGRDHPEVASSLNSLGLICFARGDYNRAEELFRRALAIDEKTFGKDSLAAAEVDNSLAQNYNGKANYAEAERLARQSLDAREKNLGKDHFLVAASLETLTEIFLSKSEYPTARKFADRAMETVGKLYSPEDLPYTDAASLLARVQVRQGNFQSAEQLLLQNLRTRERISGAESLPVANALQDLGSLYLITNDNLKAEQMNLRALALKEKILGPTHIQVGLLLHQLGLIYYRRGDYRTADTYYQRSLAIKEKVLGPDHPLVAYTVNNMGLMYWKELQYSKAAAFFRRALEIEEKAHGPESLEAVYPLSNLGIIAKETGDYDAAEAYYKRALAIREKLLGPGHPDTGTLMESLGILYRDRGDYAKAEPYFLRSIEVTEKSLGIDHPDNIRHFRNLSQLYEAEGDATKAVTAFQHLKDLEEKNLPLNLAVGSERQKLAYFDPFISSMEKIISFQVQEAPDAGEARNLSATTLVYRKGRVLDAMADSLSALWNRSSIEDRAMLDRLKNVTSQLAALVLNGPKQLSFADHQQRIMALTAQREKLEEEVARRSAGFYQETKTETLAAVRAAMPADAVLIEFGVYRPFDPKKSFESQKQWGDPRYIAYVIPDRGEVQWKDLGPTSDVDASVSAFRDALRDPGRQDVKPLARALDQKIMRPLRTMMGDATHLLVSPDGQLDLIPFEALVDEEGRYLVERFSVSYLTAGRDLLRMQVARESKSVPVVIANPAFGEPPVSLVANAATGGPRRPAMNQRRSVTTGKDLSTVYFAPLTGTAQEARAIQSLFPEAKVLTGTKATKAALKQVNAPRILHIATHGFFLQNATADASPEAGKQAAKDTRTIGASASIENPLLRSGLALSGANVTKTSSEDGILTALEAANLNLWGTKLVTLSACETGVGDVKNSEGVYGLRRSFVLAGAETLVMSLWPVSDYVTREMMTSYYTGLKKGLGRGEALRQAELAMMKRKGREHPFYWASFIQSGEWANLDGHR
jgi:CHAT domain-containing protein/tetratricopeptide (TPR) repeat protein